MKKKIIISSLLATAALGGSIAAYVIYKQSPAPAYDFATVQRGDLQEEVDVSGSVKPAQDVQLAFEKSGKVAKADVKVGDQVKAGQVLAALVDTDVNSQLNQAQAAVGSARAMLQNAQAAYDMQLVKLQDLRNGTRVEDLQLAQTQVDNAQKSVQDAQTNLQNVQAKADLDISNLYGNSGNILNDAYTKAFDALYNKTDGIFLNGMTNDPSVTLIFNNPTIESSLKSHHPLANQELAAFKSEVDALGTDQGAIDLALADSINHLERVRTFLKELNDSLNYVISSASTPPSLILSYKNNLNSALSNINSAINAISTQQKAISSQKTSNKNALATAQNQLTQADNNLAVAQKTLKLKQAGSTKEQVAAQEAAVRQAQATVFGQQAAVSQAQAVVQNYQAQAAKSIITSPIDGIISQQDAKVGQIAPMNTPVISIISNAKYQLETQVPEASIEKIKLGQAAQVTLDADSNGKVFPAKVIAVDPSKTETNGATTFKVTLEFSQEDSSIKDGLTANVKIATAERKNVLIIPSSSVIKRYNDSIVLINNGSRQGQERKIQTGISQNNQIEVISGLTDGEKIASFGLNQ